MDSHSKDSHSQDSEVMDYLSYGYDKTSELILKRGRIVYFAVIINNYEVDN